MTELTLSPMLWLNMFGAGLGTSLGLGLTIPGKSARGQFLMGAVLMVGSVAQLAIVLDHASGTPILWLEQLECTLGFLIGPLLMMLVRSQIADESPAIRRICWHFLPAVACLCWALLCQVTPLAWNFQFEVLLLQQFGYTAFAFRLAHQAGALGNGSATRSAAIQVALTFFVLLHTAQLVRYFGAHVDLFREAVPLAMTSGFVLLGVIGLRHTLSQTGPLAGNAAVARTCSTLEDSAELRVLGNLISREQVYRDPQLSLPKLALRMDLRPQQLSQLLNQELGESFFDYINRHRVEEAQRLLADPRNDRFTIEAVAESAGFKSRATFYSCFRKQVGQTPGAFRRRIRSAQS